MNAVRATIGLSVVVVMAVCVVGALRACEEIYESLAHEPFECVSNHPAKNNNLDTPVPCPEEER